jgi:hypothetical protein
MKRIFYKTIVALISFAIGLGSYLVLHKYETVSLCEVQANTEEYYGNTVRLRVTVSKERGGVVAFSVCGPTHDLSPNVHNVPAATVELKQEDFESFTLPETKYIRHEDGKVFLADAIVTGYLNPPDGITHCFSPEYTISNAKIERVLSTKEFDNMDQVQDWMDSKFR